MKKITLALITVVIFLGGCSMQPTVQKVSESKSGFDGAFYDGESYSVSKDLSNSEQYRIYEKASSGFVSLDAIITDAEQRAKDFCSGKDQVMQKLRVQTSKPPHVLGNFPRAEITFVCIDKPNVAAPPTFDDALYTRLSNLKKLLDSGAITKEEFEKEKAKILNQ
jgi:hypothetical protein